MSIDDLQKAKRHVELQILEQLRAFQKLTGFTATTVEIATHPTMGGTPVIANVTIRIEL